MTLFEYGLASGHDKVPVNIETIIPSGDIAFVPPLALPSYDPGIFKIRGDGNVFTSGFAAHQWVLGVITRKQFPYMRATYCAGGMSGLVTIRTRLADEYYRDYNAVMALTKPIEAQWQYRGYPDYKITFTRLKEVGMGDYGIISVVGASASQGLTTSFAKITGFTASGLSNNTTPDHANDQITALIAGIYDVDVMVEGTGAAGTFTAAPSVNGTESTVYQTEYTAAGAETFTLVIHSTLTLAANEVVTLEMKASGSLSYTLKNGSLRIKRVG